MVPLCFRRFLCPVLLHGPAGDVRVFAPPGGDVRVFAPPGGDVRVFAPPGGDVRVFPPPDGGYRRRTRSTTVTIGSVNSP